MGIEIDVMDIRRLNRHHKKLNDLAVQSEKSWQDLQVKDKEMRITNKHAKDFIIRKERIKEREMILKIARSVTPSKW